jgi:hypothetical protein
MVAGGEGKEEMEESNNEKDTRRKRYTEERKMESMKVKVKLFLCLTN